MVLVALLFFLPGFRQPMAFVVPMTMLAVLLRKQIASALAVLPPRVAFVGSGLVFGLATEVFAILGNWDRSDQDKILMHARPGTDLFFGVFSYGLVMLAWLPLVERLHFSLREVFVITAAYGIYAEQGGQILALAVLSPWLGIPLAAIVGAVYATFPTLAYLVSGRGFSPGRPPTRLRHDVLACLVLFLQWALFGLVVLPWLRSLPGIGP